MQTKTPQGSLEAFLLIGSQEDFGCFIATLFPIKNNFAWHTAAHYVEAFLEVINLVVVRNDWR